ncbi:cytochrome C [Geobacter benzoatilyticus]|uniref:Cytochrome C n=2 Tax=Geobacter benzoatilyticus TaxID=2815309 RepID=A0ABX7Q7N1_9BACT|nr:cytochrome C [Geobacter benzoatilyticus]
MKRIATTIAALLAMAAPAMAGHVATLGTGTCGTCHRTNLITQHGGFAAPVCQTCHDSTAAEVKETIVAGAAGQAYTCSSCHGAESHAQKHPDYMANFAMYNGVEPTYGTTVWTAPTGYTSVDPAAKLYQLCVKCHSSNGLGATTNGVSGVVGPSGLNLTDQAWEFSPTNRSAHPVVVTLNNQTGSLAPRALRTTEMKAPWTNVGNQTMTCADCHEFVDSGPQGSGIIWSLKGTNKAWPYTVAGVSTGTFQTMRSNSTSFCWNCHNFSGAGQVHTTGDHDGVKCIDCHIRVPHGGKVSRLIGTATSGLPDRYTGDGKGGYKPRVTAFKKAASGSYSESSCSTNCGEHGPISGAETW